MKKFTFAIYYNQSETRYFKHMQLINWFVSLRQKCDIEQFQTNFKNIHYIEISKIKAINLKILAAHGRLQCG